MRQGETDRERGKKRKRLTDITPSSTLADLDEVPSHTATSFHHCGDGGTTSDEFLWRERERLGECVREREWVYMWMRERGIGRKREKDIRWRQ